MKKYFLCVALLACGGLSAGFAQAQSSSGSAAVAVDSSLYQDLGGRDNIQRFTRDFVQLIIKDPRIEKFFVNTDLQRLELLLTEQFCELAGGPCSYGGRSMKDTHRGMSVMNKEFNALAEDLIIAMEKAGVPNGARNRLIAKLAPMQRDIVTK